MTRFSSKLAGSTALIVLFTACASAPPPKQEPLSLDTDPTSVATEYVVLQNGDKLPKSGNVVITSCNVAFGKKTRASASTQAGALNRGYTHDGKVRVDTKVTSELILEGIDDAQLNRISNSICSEAKTTLVQAGYNVIDASKDPLFQQLQNSGKPSPYSWDFNKNDYAVFAPSGYQIWDERFLSVAGGLKSAFRAAKGTNSSQLLTGLINSQQATGVAMHFAVAFASAEGDKGRKSMFATDDTAEITHDTRMMVTGDINFIPATQLKCWERFGKTECMADGATPRVVSVKPLIAEEQAYVAIRDVQSTGSKVAEGLANTLNMLSALAGSTGSSTIDIQQQGVEVNPAIYERTAREYSRRFVQMAMAVR